MLVASLEEAVVVVVVVVVALLAWVDAPVAPEHQTPASGPSPS
jgi:hypothetical protein